VLEIGQHTVKLMRDDRLNPTTVEVGKTEVSAHLARTTNVHDASRLMSPRTFDQDTPNMIVERPSHPGRASHVLVTEAASAMGVTVDPNPQARTEREPSKTKLWFDVFISPQPRDNAELCNDPSSFVLR
jgi:hypothetical protein